METGIEQEHTAEAGSNGHQFSLEEYQHILSPEYPEFLRKYFKLPLLQRLAGVGLLCGTDWTPLYHNGFFYSRLDHSTGVALIIWNFTHDRAQTVAGLLHDVSTTVFSHVADFRNGDALTQTSSEEANAHMIMEDADLAALLEQDGLTAAQVCDYHRYPVADNEVPQLSADRLEYMFPSGSILAGSWTLAEIADIYRDITVCCNEEGKPELGFRTAPCAVSYCRHFCDTAKLLQKNENKLALQLLAHTVSRAVECGIVSETDFFTLSEAQVIQRFEDACRTDSGIRTKCTDAQGKDVSDACRDFIRCFRTFRGMKKIYHTEQPLPDAFCVSIEVKMRYIDPLVADGSCVTCSGSALPAGQRVTKLVPEAFRTVQNLLSYHDTRYGCVPYVYDR